MNCEQTRELLTAHLDGELDVPSSVWVERHLAECPDCTLAHRQGLVLRDALRADDLYCEAPPGLAARVRANVQREVRRAPRTFRPWTIWPGTIWPWAAAAAAAVILLAFWLRPAAPPVIVAELLASHVRSLQADHLVDVPSSDRHTVKPWFQGKLDYSPPVPVSPELAGGRLDYLGGRPVAALVYRRREHRINVFVWPAKGGAFQPNSAQSYAAQGYQMARWFAAGMEWWAVSDLNAQELDAFARELQRAN